MNYGRNLLCPVNPSFTQGWEDSRDRNILIWIKYSSNIVLMSFQSFTGKSSTKLWPDHKVIPLILNKSKSFLASIRHWKQFNCVPLTWRVVHSVFKNYQTTRRACQGHNFGCMFTTMWLIPRIEGNTKYFSVTNKLIRRAFLRMHESPRFCLDSTLTQGVSIPLDKQERHSQLLGGRLLIRSDKVSLVGVENDYRSEVLLTQSKVNNNLKLLCIHAAFHL